MKQWQKIFINWLVVLLWMGVIYYFSNQPDLRSELQPFWDLIFRKIAHMAEYFILVYLLFKAYNETGIKLKPALFFAAFISIAYAISDEWHQGFVEGRTASNIDVIIDSVGIGFFVFLRLVQKPKQPKTYENLPNP